MFWKMDKNANFLLLSGNLLKLCFLKKYSGGIQDIHK